MRQILLITTSPDEGNREDYSIIYSGYLLVSSNTLMFDESAFDDGQYSHNDLIVELRRLGYTVDIPNNSIVEVLNS